MDDTRNKVEAVLFITGGFLSADEISQFSGIASAGLVKETIDTLKIEYGEKGSSLEILEELGKYKLALRKDYVAISAKLLSNTEFDRSTQETLAIIAYKQPILQSDLIKIRGNGAYDHIHLLKEREFISSEKFGRTRKLKLAQKFYEYFDLADAAVLKQKCDEIEQKVGFVEKLAKPEAQKGLGQFSDANKAGINPALESNKEPVTDAIHEDIDEDEQMPDLSDDEEAAPGEKEDVNNPGEVSKA